MRRGAEQIFSQEDKQMTKKYVHEKPVNITDHQEIQIKTTVRNPSSSVRMAIIKREEIKSTNEDCEKRDPLCTTGRQ